MAKQVGFIQWISVDIGQVALAHHILFPFWIFPEVFHAVVINCFK